MHKQILTILILLSINVTFLKGQNSDIIKVDYRKPKEYEIGGITISGVKYLDHNVLTHLSGLKVGNIITIPGDDITKAMKKLWEHGLFGDVEISATSIEENKIYLDIYLKERPRLSKFTFKGVNKSTTDDLREEIKLMRGSQVTDNMLSSTERKIKFYFNEKGYLNATVDFKQYEDTVMPNTVILEITIDKKKKVKIENINFTNVNELKELKLKRAMKDTKEKRLYNIFKTSKFIRDKYEDDKKKLIAKYTEKGYRDAKIEFDTVYNINKKRLNIDMTIFEGRKYYFRDITWVGNSKYPTEFLEQRLGIEKGDVFDQATLDKRLFGAEDAVSNLYLDKGYLFFQAIPVELQVDNDSIDLEIRIFEGKQARINRVIITGNDRTNEHVIRREIWTKPGDLFDRSAIIRTTRELAQLGYFDPEKLDVIPTPNPADGTVDIEYVVAERASDQIELSGGWGAGMVIGTLGLTFNNFSTRNIFNFDTYSPLPTGDGQKLSIRGQTNGKYYQSYSMSFTEPWLGGKKPNSLSLSLFYSKRGSYSSSYWYGTAGNQFMKVLGASAGLGRRLSWPDSYFTLYNELSYQKYTLKDFHGYFPFGNGKSQNLSFTTAFGRNSVDQPLYPRRGSNISLTLAITPPFSLFKSENFWKMSDAEIQSIENAWGQMENGNYIIESGITNTDERARELNQYLNDKQYSNRFKWVEYHKWKFKSEWYTQIVNKLVLKSNVEIGYLGFYNKALGYSPFETFQLGGDGMSGYSFYGTDIIPLRGYDNGLSNDGALTPTPQGNVYEKYTLELRYPITLKPQATIYALTFLEAGNCFRGLESFDPFHVYRSAGIGLRFFLPMFGLLGIDWGYGFDPVPGRDYSPAHKGQFAFTIGQQF